MIHLLNVILLLLGLSTGTGGVVENPTSFKNSPKKANQNESLTINTTEYAAATYTTTATEINIENKKSQTYTNTAFTLNVFDYYVEEISTALATEDLYNLGQDTTNLLIYAITPYKYIESNSIDLELTLRYILYRPIDINSLIYFDVYKSHEDLSYLLDQRATSQSQNKDLINRLKNESYAYDYEFTQFTNQVQLTQDNTSLVERTINITAATDITTYIIINTYMNNVEIEKAFNNKLFNIDSNTLNYSFIIPPENYEVIDLPGLFFTIITMPFTFLSIAFNFTLFPGTPFQVNVAQLFFSILGILILIFIVKLIIGFVGK